MASKVKQQVVVAEDDDVVIDNTIDDDYIQVTVSGETAPAIAQKLQAGLGKNAKVTAHAGVNKKAEAIVKKNKQTTLMEEGYGFELPVSDEETVAQPTGNKRGRKPKRKPEGEDAPPAVTKPKKAKAPSAKAPKPTKKSAAATFDVNLSTTTTATTTTTTKSVSSGYTTNKVTKVEAPETYDHSDDSSDYVMEIRTARPDSVKKVIEIISPLLTDAVLRFQTDGIYIFAMDAVKVAFVSVHLKAEHFEFYALKRCFDIGVDTSNLNKVLSSVQKYDSLSFIFNSEETNKNLQLVMESTTRNEIFIATIYGIDPKVNNYEIPEQRYDSIMTLPAATFQSHIHTLSQLSPIVTFKTDNKTFMMEIKAEFGEAVKIIRPCENDSADGMKFIRQDEEAATAADYETAHVQEELANSEIQEAEGSQSVEETTVPMMMADPKEDAGPSEEPPSVMTLEDEEIENAKQAAARRKRLSRSYKDKHTVKFEGPVVRATHIMKYLKVFCKATPLSKFVYMFLQEGEPLVLSYDIRGLGTLIYCICDVSEKNNEVADD